MSAPPAGMEPGATVRFGAIFSSASANADSEYGFSPLHLAAQRGHENVVRILLNSTGVQPECHTAINVGIFLCIGTSVILNYSYGLLH